MEMITETTDINPPSKTAANTEITTAKTLFQLNFVIRKFGSHRARMIAGNNPTLWQMSDMLMALNP